jgi:hypothetical protein
MVEMGLQAVAVVRFLAELQQQVAMVVQGSILFQIFHTLVELAQLQ